MRHAFLVVIVKKWSKSLYTFTEVITKLKQGYHFLDTCRPMLIERRDKTGSLTNPRDAV